MTSLPLRCPLCCEIKGRCAEPPVCADCGSNGKHQLTAHRRTLVGRTSSIGDIGRQITPRRALVGPDVLPRDRPLVAFALLALLPGMREDADRARQAEQPARERGGKAELRI